MKKRWDKIEDPFRNFLYGDIIEDQGSSKLERGLGTSAALPFSRLNFLTC
jgi:hypothetical protein